MNFLTKGWFSEVSSEYPNQAFSLKVKEVLFEGKSEFQDIFIFENEDFGRVLVLDGRVQLTERDEAFYQEMLTYIPLNVHPNPKRILIIGGGDGGVAREAARHPCVEHVDLVEIDEMQLAHQNKYDVIITDSTDPGGPSSPLFNREYFRLLSQVLTDDGIICNQGESLFLDLPVIQRMLGFCKEVFPVVGYAYNIIPTYTCGHLGYVLACKNKNINLSEAIREPLDHCKFYTNAVHKAAFVLPKCYEDALKPLLNA